MSEHSNTSRRDLFKLTGGAAALIGGAALVGAPAEAGENPYPRFRTLEISGNRMEPAIMHGGGVVVDTCASTRPMDEGMYAFIDSFGEPRLYRVTWSMKTGGYILSSDNKMYPPEHVPMDWAEMETIGKVVGILHPEYMREAAA